MRTFVLAAAALPALAAPAFAGDVVTPSRISRVTVYEDRALVDRTATANLPAGTTRIVLPGLPARVDADSLRARSSQVKVLGVDVERVQLAREAHPDAEAARRAWDAARRDVATAELDAADAKDAWDRLRSLRAAALERASNGLAGQPVDVAGIDKLLALADEKGAAARLRVISTQTRVEEAKAIEDAARRRMDALAAAAQKAETRIVVTVSAAAAVENAAFSVQYMIPDASWRPVYDLRVGEDFGAASLEMTAVVSQRTGEDWRDVPMELTTAQPSAGAAPPEPEGWFVDLLEERARGGFAVRDAAPAAAPMESRDAEKSDAGFGAPVRRSGLVVAFTSAANANVASDGQPSRVALGRFDLAPSVRWVAFPRVTDKVFVTSKLRNTTGSPLPAGEARVFVGPDYVGPMAVEDWGQDQEIDVGLGADREVVVERETLKQERSTEGVFSKDTVHQRAYRVTVRNHRARSVDVRLLDQVPVSQNEELKVEMLETSIALAKLEAREEETNRARGVLEWRFPVASKATVDLRFGWRVTFPKGRTVIGFDD